MNKCIPGWTAGQDERIGGRTIGQLDRQMSGQMDKLANEFVWRHMS